MRWFKHMTASHNDETLSELMEEFGAEGYGVWWIILEKIAHAMDEKPRSFARFSLKVWANSAKVSAKKFQNIATFLEKNGSIFLKYDKKYLEIDCPNLLKYRDEYTENLARKEAKNRDIVTTNSRQSSGETPTLARARSDTEADTDTEYITGTKVPVVDSAKSALDVPRGKLSCPHEKIIELYHQQLPMCPRIKEWHKTRRSFLKRRWQEDPERQSLSWWGEFLAYVAQSDFLTGGVPGRDGNPPFVADLEWLVRPTNFAKVIEGKYHRGKKYE